MRLKTILLFALMGCLLLLKLGCQFHPASSDRYFSDVRIAHVPDSSSVAVYVVLNLSAYPDQAEGLAHYTEHLVWQNALGGDVTDATLHSNAWTNSYTIGYWLSGPKSELADLLTSLSRVFDPIEVSAEFAKSELDIVNREYDRRLLENVDGQAAVTMNQFLYRGNAIATPLMGTPDIIYKLDYNDAEALRAATHTQANAVLVVVGDVTDADVQQAMGGAGIAPLDAAAVGEKSPTTFTLAEPVSEVFRYNSADSQPRITIRKVVSLSEPVAFELLEFQASQLGAMLETSLPGGLAGPLRYDHFIARSFSINVRPLDEQHIELRFDATPDNGVTLDQLHSSFEQALQESMKGIPEETFNRIRKRSDSYWPDWEDENESSRWMQSQILRKTSNWREPLSSKELRQVQKVGLSHDALNDLLKSFQGAGREAVALIGNTDGEYR